MLGNHSVSPVVYPGSSQAIFWLIYTHVYINALHVRIHHQICEGADKQLAIANKVDDISDQWDRASFEFTAWKTRGVPVLKVKHGGRVELQFCSIVVLRVRRRLPQR